MSGDKIIGFCWGLKQFGIVEIRDGMPLLNCRLLPDEGTPVVSIQKALRDNRFESRRCSLSIPNSESMIRSFVLPLMHTSEVDRVVEYEIKKYIPFPLEQLVFVYHPFQIVDKNVKKIRIVLAAVRKEVLFQYTRNLEQSGLNLFSAEPASVSLVRALVYKKEIRLDQKVVVVVLDQAQGQILFIQKGVCHFVRDFSLLAVANDQAADEDVTRKKLINEIHMSMDFYNRQFEEDKTAQMLVLSAYEDGALTAELAKEFAVAVRHLTPVQVLRIPSADVQAIYAYGAALAVDPVLKTSFNFSKKQSQSEHSFLPAIDWFLFERVIKTAVVCLVVYVLAWGLAQVNIQHLKKEALAISQRQQSFVELSAEEILAKAGKNNRQLSEYKNIRLSSQLSVILLNLPSLFSDGLWLRDLSVKYIISPKVSKDDKDAGSEVSLGLEVYGYVSLDDANKEIRVVNDLTAKLKNHPVLGRYFKNAVINSVERQVYQEKTVTVFTMNCS